NIIKSTLKKHLPKHNNINYDEIALTLLNEMFEVDKMNDISNILELSNEDKNSINFIINNILGKSNDFKFNILSKFTRLKEISLSIKILREKLNSTVSGDFLNNYLETTAILNKQISETENIIASSKAKLEEKYKQLSLKEYHLTRAKNELTSLLQNNNVLEMSSSIISYLDKLLKNITRDKIDAIEEEFINIFKNIIRKDNYVNSIVIDDSFNSTLYINKEYDTNEILNILTNLGFEGTEKKYGSKFIDDLFNYFDVANYKSLTKKLEQMALVQYISLSSKVNINDFSKGEKQIYILCLIWAIIKSSGVEIPFIIDTPYARIDETHRNALTTTYLPNISKQVIILSTNKEIDSDLYQVVKPYVCNEYLLLYNTNLRKTEVKNGYFEV
ncbi:TPA: DNA sulfur modification protein DndD, partial [Clostridium perfringens]|nr:DNA sulfur modification protein DndD [Clostridium perfringens]